jgi:hypothetical protein
MPLYPQGGGLYPNSIDNVLLADMADATVKGRAKGAGTGDPQDLTAAQLGLLLGGPNFRNILGRNGGFEVWQRGAGGSAAFSVAAGGGLYAADGWFIQTGANEQCSVGQTAGITAGSRWAAYVSRNAGQTGTGPIFFEFPLDADEIFTMRGSIVTLSFTSYALANWSPAGGILTCTLFTGTGAVAKAIGGYTNLVQPVQINAALTGVATRFSATSPAIVPANITQASVVFQWTPVGTAGANDVAIIDDVQLEIGSIATPFERRPFESELLACRRHFQKSFQYAAAPAANADSSSAVSTPQIVGASQAHYPASIPFPVAMRATPTIAFFNPGAAGAQARNYGTGTDCTLTATWSVGMDRFTYSTTTPAGSAAGQPILVNYTADAGI